MDTASKQQPNPVPHHKPESFYERNAVALQWGIIGVAFLAACGIYWWRYQSAIEASALTHFVLAQDPEDYAKIVADSPGTRAANWAKLREANGYLDSALKDAFSNREKADTDLEKASKLLAELKKSSGPDELKEQVLFAYARSLEMTSSGDLDQAVEAYKALIKQFPETHFKREANERIHALQRPDAQEFYAYFSKQNPKPADPARPKDEKAAKKGDGVDNPFKPISPDLGKLKVNEEEGGPVVPLLAPPSLPEKKDVPDEAPAVPDTTKKKDKVGEESKPETSSTDEKKPDADKPAEQPTAAEKPAEKPAAAETKTEEKKADEKPSEPKATEEKKP